MAADRTATFGDGAGGGDETEATVPAAGRTPSDRRAAAAQAGAAASALAPGDCLGRYTVLEKIGGGGMGEVFRAHDPQLARDVALKVILPGPGESPEGRARFQREAQAMARLNHPNVVAVHDVGSVDDRDFVAMELVEGPTVADWIAEAPRPWREVVEVFLQAGRGLAAAHASGIVHRDFKPGNVILGDRVRVADFGLARAAHDPLPAADTDSTPPPVSTPLGDVVTRTGHALGTPAYMSPEQRAGSPVGPLSDQYSFGLSLHEALTGERLGQPRRGAPRPVPRRLRAVVDRALRHRPEDRFPSMQALLAELGRDPAWARRRWIAAAAAVGLALAGALVARRRLAAAPCTGGEALIAPLWDDAARGRVADAFRRTGRAYAQETFDAVDAGLQARLGAWARAHRDACEATRVRHEQSDTLLDLRMRCLSRSKAEIAALIGVLDDVDPRSLDRAVQAVSQAGDLERCSDLVALAAAAPPPRDPQVARRLEQLRLDRSRSRALQLLGNWKQQQKELVGLLARARDLGYPPVLADTLLDSGSLEIATGDVDLGIEQLYEAVRVASQAKEDETAAAALGELIFAYGSRKQEFEQAEVCFRLAGAAVARAGSPPRLQRRIYNYWAHTLDRRREDAQALPVRLFVYALAVADRGAESPEAAMSLASLGSTVRHLGRVPDAQPLFDRALPILEKQVGPRHPWYLAQLSNAARNRMDAMDFDQAAAMFERVLAIREETMGPDDASVADTLDVLAELRYEQRRLDEARALEERAIRIRIAVLGPDHPYIAQGKLLLGVIAQVGGDPAGAHELYVEAQKIGYAAWKDTHPKLADMFMQDATALLQLDRIPEARAAVERAIEIDRKAIGEDHPEHAGTMETLAQVLRAERRFAEAAEASRRAVALSEQEMGTESPVLVAPLIGLCNELADGGDGRSALAAAARAVRLAAGANAELQGQARFCSARAEMMSGGSRAHALAEAKAARALLSTLPYPAREVKRIDDWLAAQR